MIRKIFENEEKDFVRRALQCRNGIGLAGGKLLHNVTVEFLKLSGLSAGEGVSSGLGSGEEGREVP